MGSYKSSGSFKPFSQLKILLHRHDGQWGPHYRQPANGRHPSADPTASRTQNPEPAISDDEMFKAAMADVVPLAGRRRAATDLPLPSAVTCTDDPDQETVEALRCLIASGKGFVVSQTSGYVEGTACGVHPEIARRLHRGAYAVEAHIDLHGLTGKEAHALFDAFLKDALATGKRTVLIIHGRGLSSPAEPVLKTMVYRWLTTGFWRKWVLAFASARLVDGGTGATCVLLKSGSTVHFTRRCHD